MIIIKDFEKEINVEFIKGESLSKHTTYKVGGKCDYYVLPKNLNELIDVLVLIKKNNLQYKVIGNGSNLIFSSKDYSGIIINLKNMKNLEIVNNLIKVDAGYSLSKLSLEVSNRGLKGLDFAAGIPASVGGAVYMNAGCYGSDMSKIVTSVTVLDYEGNIIELTNEECKFSYRKSVFQTSEYIILNCTLKLGEGNKDELMALISERRNKRLLSQPLDMPTAGSVFKNPEGLKAWELIDKAGFRGKSIGGAKVSEKHANFIINNGNATGEDIKALISLIQKEVKEKYCISLELEQELVNF